MIIQTTSGLVTSKNPHLFLGIPYGKATRFQKPEKNTWEELKKCDNFGKMPPQEDFLKRPEAYGEDCLSLNIATPEILGKFPVVVEFYGGAFQGGSNQNSGMTWLNQEKIVHVIFNYRLGYLGWPLKKSPDIESYNLGLYDQYLALQWIKENIASFGGDEENITLYGFSAGAKSIMALLASELPVKPLFQKIALSSGSYQCLRSKKVAERLDNLFKKEVLGEADLLTASLEEIMTKQKQFLKRHEATNFFGPVLDGIVITKNWQKNLTVNLPEQALISSSYNECGDYLLKTPEKIKDSLLSDLFGENKRYFPKELVEKIEYPKEKGELVQLISDANYRLHAHRLGNLYRKVGVTVYEYDFSLYPAKHSSDIGFLEHPQVGKHQALQVSLRTAFLQFFTSKKKAEIDFSFAFQHPTIKNYYEITLDETPSWHDYGLIDSYPLTIFDEVL